MTDRHHLLVHGATFAAVGDRGDISGVRGGGSPDGLFVRDARHLSRWQLTVDGAVPELLTPVADGGTARCVLVPRGARPEPPAHTLFREQAVGDSSFVETVRVTSNRPVPTTIRLAITADADFADQFELRPDHRTYVKAGALRSRIVLDDGIEFAYRRAEWRSCTTITADPAPEAVEETGTGARRLVWTLELPPGGTRDLVLRVMARPHGDRRALRVPRDPSAMAAQLTASEAEFVEGVAFPTGWPELAAACARGLTDLAALQIPATGPDGEELRVPAGGAPWYLTLLARDALLTSLFALPYRPRPAAATLFALAATQAGGSGGARGAEPGKIVHEVRHGELAHFGQVPYARYYGSVDATPLFLVLLGAYTEQTGDLAPARRLEAHARAAVGWMLDHGGLTSRGYLVYRADEGGLANQNWKDSPGAICRADGTRPSGPVMAAGAQGYAYDALRRTAWVARAVWADETYAALLEQAAADLRDRFQRDFWMREASFPALALDGEGRGIDALASDAGHLLWTGLLDKEYGEVVGRRLLEPDFFSGWGVRTLAAGQPAYHPLSPHRGSVWPHDNALIALGLARYGLHDEARAVAHALIDAASFSPAHRLPEVLAGYPRTTHPEPVPYPHACTRESRSAAAPLALLTAVGGA
ncbi:glycogen debranching N-terminal domain-containing protein [Streptomyces griseofuscus]|nr:MULTISPECIES: glycogen debranching N-terminal domain-containing protein [unclassified Streptomyces]MYQ95139.1 aminotransferase [Streptomyces sp. SID4946]SCF58166.1 Glycogen debranching enzyme (alpha-1,6-glucosidase) [Streptomyces sp. LamerLS-31b]SCF93806.1 Glycogen debranching enzyme (alpha-1,6-glucosidase) [Streptomyces sp. DconLS]